jgi:predicted SnoaL-like aldol condensation-catalyzing enzyme
MAEGDLVTLAFVQQNTEPKDAAKKYATSWFDMFRIENGLIVEHGDSASKN